MKRLQSAAWKTVLFIGLFLIINACTLTSEPESDFPFELLMTPQDLPSGWFRDGFDFPEVPEADVRGAFFSGSSDPDKEYLLVSHTLGVYSSEDKAKNAYADWESQWFPTDTWKTPEGFNLSVEDTQDQYRLSCIQVSINENPILWCRYLQQHANLISLILANIDDAAISLSDLEGAVHKLDERMQGYNAPN